MSILFIYYKMFLFIKFQQTYISFISSPDGSQKKSVPSFGGALSKIFKKVYIRFYCEQYII